MSKPQDQLVNSGIQVINSISSILPFLKTYFCISICFIIPNKIDILGGGVFHLYNVSMTYKVYLDGLFYIRLLSLLCSFYFILQLFMVGLVKIETQMMVKQVLSNTKTRGKTGSSFHILMIASKRRR